jgi:hypothetical protein
MMNKINFEDFHKASQFIKDVLDGKRTSGRVFLDLPEHVNKKAEFEIGHEIETHSIGADEIRHVWRNHGVGGKKNDDNAIPLRKEDIALMPYIMVTADKIEKGSRAANGCESIQYTKILDSGIVIVVEREGRFDEKDMEQVTMWANKKSLSPYGAVAPTISSAPRSTSETLIISPKDAAKIMQDFEITKNKIEKMQSEAKKVQNTPKKKKGRRM